MKKLFLGLVTIASFAGANAQKTTFGIQGGVQSTTIALRLEEDDEKVAVETPGVGFTIGGVADIAVSDHFSVQPNLLFSYKGGKTLFPGQGKLSAMSIDLPINALYRHNGFFIGAGPNFSYGVSGKIKPFEDDADDLDFYDKEDGEDAPIKRFEIGVNGVMGYQFASGFGLSVNYTRGLNNLVNDDDADDDIKWNFKRIGLNFTYMFGKNK